MTLTETERKGQRMTLKQAAEEFFGDACHASTLRVEIARGRLAAAKIGRAYWVTWPALVEMEAKCHVEAPALNSGSTRTAKPGRSSTGEGEAARDSALMKLAQRRKVLGITSRKNTNRQAVQTR